MFSLLIVLKVKMNKVFIINAELSGFGKPNIYNPLSSRLYRSKVEEEIHMTALTDIYKGDSPISFKDLFETVCVLLVKHEGTKDEVVSKIVSELIQEEKDKISREFKRNLDYDKFRNGLSNLELKLSNPIYFSNSLAFKNKLEKLIIDKINLRLNKSYELNSYEILYNTGYELLLEIKI